MDELTRIRTFMSVVQAGSFSAASRHLSSISSVVRQVNALEEELGVRLLNRSTRRLSLTDAGRLFYERVTKIADDLDSAKLEVRSLKDDVRGQLKVSLRVTAGTTIVVPALPKLLAQYPELHLDILLTDERRDLIANRIDVAMWMGDLGDANLVAKRLSPTRRIVCGSPGYLDKHGVPSTPDDLRHHNCLVFAAPSYGNRWGFARDGKTEEVDVRGSVRSDNGLILLSSGIAGLGLIIVHEWMVRNLIAEGRMTPVLSDYTVNPRPGDADLYAVYPSGGSLSRKVKAFVDFLIETFDADTETNRSQPSAVDIEPVPT